MNDSDDSKPTGMGDDYASDKTATRGTPEPSATNRLNAEDERSFQLWQANLVLQDPRANNKGLALLVRAAMNDDRLRAALIDDPASVLAKVGDKYGLPEGLNLRFLENTQDTLNVVLPRRAGELREQDGEIRKHPKPLRDLLISGTDFPVVLAPFMDDFNRGNLFDPMDSTDTGDAHSVDG